MASPVGRPVILCCSAAPRLLPPIGPSDHTHVFFASIVPASDPPPLLLPPPCSIITKDPEKPSGARE
eukprot:765759-Hanusia_phi.AAC.2